MPMRMIAIAVSVLACGGEPRVTFAPAPPLQIRLASEQIVGSAEQARQGRFASTTLWLEHDARRSSPGQVITVLPPAVTGPFRVTPPFPAGGLRLQSGETDSRQVELTATAVGDYEGLLRIRVTYYDDTVFGVPIRGRIDPG
jgi:hypothetical protein